MDDSHFADGDYIIIDKYYFSLKKESLGGCRILSKSKYLRLDEVSFLKSGE